MLLGGPTKKSKFSDTKFVSILKQAAAGEGALPPPHGIGSATCYNWKSKF